MKLCGKSAYALAYAFSLGTLCCALPLQAPSRLGMGWHHAFPPFEAAAPRPLRSSSSDDNSPENSDPFTPAALSSLAARIASIRDKDVKRSNNLSRNWREGYWSVRGFAISDDNDDDGDDMSIMLDAEEGFAKLKEKLQQNKPNSSPAEVEPDAVMEVDETVTLASLEVSSDGQIIVVGTTDGSVVAVRVGMEPYTRFVKRQKIQLSTKETIKSSYAFVREDEDAEYDDDEDTKATKFQILGDWSVGKDLSVVSIVAMNDVRNSFAVSDSKGGLNLISVEEGVVKEVHLLPLGSAPVGLMSPTPTSAVVAYDNNSLSLIEVDESSGNPKVSSCCARGVVGRNHGVMLMLVLFVML